MKRCNVLRSMDLSIATRLWIFNFDCSGDLKVPAIHLFGPSAWRFSLPPLPLPPMFTHFHPRSPNPPKNRQRVDKSLRPLDTLQPGVPDTRGFCVVGWNVTQSTPRIGRGLWFVSGPSSYTGFRVEANNLLYHLFAIWSSKTVPFGPQAACASFHGIFLLRLRTRNEIQ